VAADTAFAKGTDKWKVLIMLQMGTIIQHLAHHLSIENAERYELIYNNTTKHLRSTSDLQTWYTTKKFLIPNRFSLRLERLQFDFTFFNS
jgi:hypothetical protein